MDITSVLNNFGHYRKIDNTTNIMKSHNSNVYEYNSIIIVLNKGSSQHIAEYAIPSTLYSMWLNELFLTNIRLNIDLQIKLNNGWSIEDIVQHGKSIWII